MFENHMHSKKQTFLEKIDIFGIGIAIRFNHQSTHNTRFGGLITLIILAVIFFQLNNVLYALFTQKDPMVIQSDDYVFQAEPFQIKPKTFNIAMGLQDVNFNQFMNEQIYKIEAKQHNLVKFLNKTTNEMDEKWTYQNLKMSPCIQENFQIDDLQKYFLKLPYQIMYCFDTNEESAVIEGEFSAEIYRAIVIEFKECIGEGCATDEEKLEFLKSPTLGIFFSNSIVQIQEKTKIQLPVGKNLYWLSGPNFQKYLTLNLMNTYVNTDTSFYGESFEKQRIVNFSSTGEQVLPRLDEVMFRLTIVYEKNREVNFYRRYVKIDEAFSSIGGMFNALLSVGFIICSPISQLELNRKLLNSIFNISDGKTEEERKKKNGKDKRNKQNNQQDFQSRQSSINTLNNGFPQKQNTQDMMMQSMQKNNSNINKSNKLSRGNQIKDEISQFFKIHFSELQVKFKDYLFYYFRYFKSFQTTKQKLITYGTNKLYNHLDIFYIVNKLIEVEKLKHLLLNENQIKLFEYLPRPELRIEEINLDDKEDISKQNIQNEQKKGSKNNKKLQEQQSPISGKSPKLNKQKSSKKNENTKFSFFGQEEKTWEEKAFEAQKAFNQIYDRQNKSKTDEKILNMLDLRLVNLFKENSFDIPNIRLQAQFNLNDFRLDENLTSRSKKSFTNFSDQIYKLENEDKDSLKFYKNDSNFSSSNQSMQLQYPPSNFQDKKYQNNYENKMDYIEENDIEHNQGSQSVQQQNYFPSHVERHRRRIEAKNLDEDDD